MSETQLPGPLAGVRVADFTHILAGPYCTQLMADAGADVIKIEPPAGEYSRIRGALRRGDNGQTVSSYSAAVNRGKRSLSLNLKSDGGRAVARRLLDEVDVVIENFAPGAMERLGLGLQDLRAERPSLVTCSISLWGVDSSHALAGRGGLAIIAEGESGLMDMIRDTSGRPVPPRIPLGDMSAGLAAYAAIVTALLERERTGTGRHIPISMVATLLSFNSIAVTYQQFAASEPVQAPAGLGVFPTLDGYICMGVNSDRLWERLVTAIGRPELAADPRYAQYEERDARKDEANELLAEWTSQRTSDEVIAVVAPSGVPCGRIATAEDILERSEVRELGFLRPIDDGLGGTIEAPVSPLGDPHLPASVPRLGAHSHEIVVGELGFDEETYRSLLDDGVFGPHEGVAHA